MDGTALFAIRAVSFLDASGTFVEGSFAGASNPAQAMALANLWPEHSQPFGMLHLCKTGAHGCPGARPGVPLCRGT